MRENSLSMVRIRVCIVCMPFPESFCFRVRDQTEYVLGPWREEATIYVASVDGVVAKINCLDALSGELIWKQDVGWVWVSDGLVFIPGVDGYVNCLDAESGHICLALSH